MGKTKKEENLVPEIKGAEDVSVAPIDFQRALENYSPEDKKEIMDLAESIDVRKIENVMNYGANVLKKTFEQCGTFLKDERGSAADREVIQQVIELSNKASKNYEDFNLVLKEPNFFQKLILSITTGGKGTHTQKVQQAAITNYKLLIELKHSCENWITMLKDAMGEITNSFISDTDNVILLEKYLVAGYIAQERIEKELNTCKEKYEESGIEIDGQEYNELKEGYDIFTIVLSNLEKSRAMYKLSQGQLLLVQKSNRNVQISINTQMNNSMTLMGQQLRNAVLNAKNKEVIEGQQAISRLNDELIKEISETIGITTQDSEKLMYAGFYNIESAKQAITTVINTCQSIQNTAEEMLPKMKAETAEINQLIDELEPYIDKIKQEESAHTTEYNNKTSHSSGNLKF